VAPEPAPYLTIKRLEIDFSWDSLPDFARAFLCGNIVNFAPATKR
jgi:hypothetical protein